MLIGQPTEVLVASPTGTIYAGERGIFTGVLLNSNLTADVSLILQEENVSGAVLGTYLLPGTEDSKEFTIPFAFTSGLFYTLAGTGSKAYIYTRKGLATN